MQNHGIVLNLILGGDPVQNARFGDLAGYLAEASNETLALES